MLTLLLPFLTLSVFSKHLSDVPVGPFLYYDTLGGNPYNVTADKRSWIINGQRTLLLGGSIHYPRFSVGQWPDILANARSDGLNHVQVYVFWNIHEFSYSGSGTHTYDFTGRANLPKFLEECANAGLFVDLRIGPYVCAEWDFGGLPVWLLHIDGIEFRANNQQWENAMSQFVNDLSPYIEPYLAKNGGPIIMAQIENEYHGDMNYVDWCGDLAMSLNYNVSWIMCNGESAPQTINTCNAENCYQYAQVHDQYYPSQPLGWTEDWSVYQWWSGFYDPDSTGFSNRSPEDMGYSVSIWLGAGGSHHNYYMWSGGNHISHWAGSSISNYYSDGANYHSDGLPHEPKRSHLVRLHQILAANQVALLSVDAQIGNEIPITPVGETNLSSKKLLQYVTFAYEYKGPTAQDVLTFLVNMGNGEVTLPWNGQNYDLPGLSVSILDYNGNELYNSGKVNSTGLPTERVYTTVLSGNSDLTFSCWNEYYPIRNNTQKRSDNYTMNISPLEQIRFSNESSEYLIYSTDFTVDNNYPSGSLEVVFTGRMSNGYLLFINDNYLGETHDYTHSAGNVAHNMIINVDLSVNTRYTLSIVSTSFGIDNYYGVVVGGNSDAQDKKGIIGNVLINGAATIDLTNNNWYHWIGTTAENLQVFSSGINNVNWVTPIVTTNAMTWYKTSFNIDSSVFSKGVILLDIGNENGMKRGHFYLNGIDMGHYNNIIQGNLMVQRYYFIPNDLLNTDSINTLLFCEEFNNPNPSNINIVVSNVIVPEN